MSKVLLVDNNPPRLEVMRRTLEQGGFETFSAFDGNEGLRTFLNEVPDLVLVGPFAANPEENFCRRMRETRPGNFTPIVLYAEAMTGETLKSALARSGCNVFVEIPASDERLIEVCRHALVESAPAPTPVAPASKVTATPAKPAFATPDAATAELETQGMDIDHHLETLFETGEAPPPQEWDAEPELSLETDIAPDRLEADSPDQLEIDTIDAVVETTPLAAPETDAPAFDPDNDLLGIQPDEITFDAEPEAAPLPDPEPVASNDVPPPAPAEYDEPTVDFPADVPEPPQAVQPAIQQDPVAYEAPELAVDDSAALEDAPPMAAIETAEVSTRSRGWLLWAVLIVAVLGSAGAFVAQRSPEVRETIAGWMPGASAGSATSAAATAEPETAEPVQQTPTIVSRNAEGTTPESANADSGGPAPVVPGGSTATESTTSTPGATDQQKLIDSIVAKATAEVESTPKSAPALEPKSVASASTPVVETPRAQPPAAKPVAVQQPEPKATVSQPATTTAAAPSGSGSESSDSNAENTASLTPALKPQAATPPPAPKPNREIIYQPSMEVIDASNADGAFTPPKSIERVEPSYDGADVLDGGETVVLRILVNDWGKAVQIDVKQGHPGNPLVEAAIDAALKTRFKPAKDGDRAVRAWATETYRFK